MAECQYKMTGNRSYHTHKTISYISLILQIHLWRQFIPIRINYRSSQPINQASNNLEFESTLDIPGNFSMEIDCCHDPCNLNILFSIYMEIKTKLKPLVDLALRNISW